MHAVARNPAITREQFDALYDPLDLYSDDPARVRRALDALWTDWITTNGKTNNLRVFCNGALVLPDDACALADVAATLSASAAEEDVQMLRTMYGRTWWARFRASFCGARWCTMARTYLCCIG